MRWRNFVALGDSFTEGMDDRTKTAEVTAAGPIWSPAGWPGRIGGDFGYANLAVRGRLLPRVVEEQVPRPWP
jgi:hypothetical protein